MLIEAEVTRWFHKLGNGVITALRLTPGTGALAVSQAEGEGDEASRGGIRFHLASSAATGIAPVQALPTTAAQWLLYNPTSSPIVAFVDRIGAWLVSGTAGAGGTLLMGVCGPNNIPTTRPVANQTGLVVTNANPQSARASKLVIVSGATLANSPGWQPLAFMNPAGTLLGQTQMEAADIRGKLIVGPDCGIALAVISPTGTTPLFAPYASWREYATDLE
jgi:hypothetical protein